MSFVIFWIFFKCCCLVSGLNSNIYLNVNTTLNTYFMSIITYTSIECSVRCDREAGCLSFGFNADTKECQLSTDHLLQYPSNGPLPHEGWKTFASTTEWLLAFRGTPGANQDVYDAYKSATGVTTTDATCMKLEPTSCTQHYRNPIIDSWNSLGPFGVRQAKYSLYNMGEEAAYVVFDAVGSTITSWFNPASLRESSWSELFNETSFAYFSLQGDSPGRRFFISVTYDACPTDTAYTMAPCPSWFPCFYDNPVPYPTFYYSTGQSYGFPEFMTGMELADVVAIFIR